jgi:GNAT superfamily N-acetyltransferase
MMAAVTPCETTEQIEAACVLLEKMYPEHAPDYLREGIAKMAEEGWRMVGVFGDAGVCIATISYRLGMRLFCGRFLQMESMFIDPAYRRHGYGKALFDWLEVKAREEDCKRILLESYVENFSAHQFFYDQGYFIRGYVINKVL